MNFNVLNNVEMIFDKRKGSLIYFNIKIPGNHPVIAKSFVFTTFRQNSIWYYQVFTC